MNFLHVCIWSEGVLTKTIYKYESLNKMISSLSLRFSSNYSCLTREKKSFSLRSPFFAKLSLSLAQLSPNLFTIFLTSIICLHFKGNTYLYNQTIYNRFDISHNCFSQYNCNQFNWFNPWTNCMNVP